MNRILYSFIAVAMTFLALSCEQEKLEPVDGSNTVTYTVQIPDALGTKALGDDVSAVNELVYEVYRTKETRVEEFTDADNLLYHKTAKIENGVATVSLELINNQNFTVLFWAHVKDNGVYDTSDLTEVKIESPDKANNVYAQSFAGRDFVIDCKSETNGYVTLQRPVSQLNIGTTKKSLTAFEDDIKLNGSSVKVTGLSNQYNVASLSADEVSDTEFEFTETAVPTEELLVGSDTYVYVGMNYVGFAANEGSNIKVSYDINTSEGHIKKDISSVPVKPNYRTNIVGNIITSTSDYVVTLDAEWSTPGEVYEIWDGMTKNMPEVVDGKYIIKKSSEFAWLEAPQILSYDVVLAGDIDMGGNKFQGILSNGKKFDGAGFTLMNVKLDYSPTQYWSSLFVTGGGSVASSNIYVKNLTVDGAYVVATKTDNGNAAVIASYAEAKAEIENVHIKNSTVNGTIRTGALVGFVTKSGDVLVKDCSVDGVTINTFDVTGESGAVGGVAGGVVGKLVVNNTSISNSIINTYVNDDEQKRTVAKYIGNFYGESASLQVTDGSINNVKINLLNDLAKTQSCLYTEYLGGWRNNGGSVSINGIEITKDQTNEDITISTSAELTTALTEATDGAVIPVSGEISTTSLSVADGKSITIVGMSEDAVINSSAQSVAAKTDGNITFKNMTFKFSSSNDHYNSGIDADGGALVFENCKFEGIATADGDITYNNCQFTNTTEGKYAAWVYAGNVVYNNCSFKGVDRAVKVYGGSSLIKATYNDCTFEATKENDPDDPNKAGVEVTVKDYTSTLVVEVNNPTIINTAAAEHYGNEYFNIEAAPNMGNGIVTLDGHTYAQLADGTALSEVLDMESESITANLQNDVTVAGGTVAYACANTEVVTVNGNKKTLTFTDAYRTYVSNAGGKFILNDVNIVRNTTSTNTHFYDYNISLTNVELNKVEFDRGINVDGSVVMNNVLIEQKNVDTYAMFVFVGSNLSMDKCNIVTADDKGRGIKVTNEDRKSSTATTSLTVKKTCFDTCKKAAILVMSHTATDIVLDKVDITNVAADSVNPVWVDEAGAAYYDLVTVTGGTKIQE